MNPTKPNSSGKIQLTAIAIISIVVILLVALSFASFGNNQIPDHVLPVNSSTELNLSTYFQEFPDNVWFSASRTRNLSVLFGTSLSEPWKFYRNSIVSIVPFKGWTGEETIEFKATNGTEVIKKSFVVRVVPSTTTTSPESSVFSPLTTTTLMNLIERASVLITESIQSSGRKIGISAPSQLGTLWKDNFSDSTGISTIRNLNLYK